MEKPTQQVDVYRKATNPNYLHLVTSYLDEEQVKVFLNAFVRKLIDSTGIKELIYCKFEINVVTDSKGKSIEHRQGSTYVHLSDERVGWALLKKDLDGTIRKKVEERKEVESIKTETMSGSNSSLDSVKSSTSWADMMEEEELWELNHTINLPPWVEFWPIKYTEEQLQFIKNSSKWNDETITIGINPARIKDFSKLTKDDKEFGCAPHILYSMSQVTDEKEKDFQDLFRQYATDSKTEFFWQHKNKKTKGRYVTYPVVEIREYTNKLGKLEKHAFIFFDSTTFDAQYAFNMRRQVVIKGKHHVFVFARKSIL